MPTIVDNSSVKKICVDDFALKKRVDYGTVMVDLESHRIIDMIPSRDINDVKNWLASYPKIEVLSRDGAQLYANAAKSVFPDVIQVSDRFHLIKGITEAIDKIIIRLYPARLEIPAVSEQPEEIKNLLNINNRVQRIKYAQKQRESGMTVAEIAFILHSTTKTVNNYLSIDVATLEDNLIAREEQHKLALEQKQKDIDEIRSMASKGIAVEQIAKITHHTPKTIQRYLDTLYSVENGHYHIRIPGKLAPYEKEVIELRSKGITYAKIHEIISAKGYNGSVASLRMFIQKERQRNNLKSDGTEYNSDYQPKEFVQRKSISQLIYKKIDDVFTITEQQLEQVLKTYPLIGELYALIKEFYEIVFSKKSDKLDGWLAKLDKYDIPELQTYVNGVRKDITAVKNGIDFQYNNGLAEGSVNKIKVIKRIMYGRNSFELLKAKVLFGEQFHC